MRESADSVRSEKPYVVAAIPCLNTESWIADVIVKARQRVDRVVVVDDGSTDSTARVASQAGALVVSHGKNRGYGAAIRSCIDAAKAEAADALVILDGDGQHEAEEIPEILAPILEDGAELVIGSRFLSKTVKMPRYRRFGIGVITGLFNFASRVRVSDAQSGFRAYNKRLLGELALSEEGMSVSIEILEQARRKQAAIREVAISCQYGASSLNSGAIKHGLGVALSVIRLRLKNGLHR